MQCWYIMVWVYCRKQQGWHALTAYVAPVQRCISHASDKHSSGQLRYALTAYVASVQRYISHASDKHSSGQLQHAMPGVQLCATNL